MGRTKAVLLPGQQKILHALGENIKFARLRRDFSAELTAERAGISRVTLSKVESGDPGAAMGAYLKTLFVLGLERDLLAVAKDDVLGRKLQDAALLPKKRASKKEKR
ncbi:MAG: helix-turn-helix domain-containing protein [Spirochaetaceae bacterium]|nr:helix-turn-helix domain-containing protein [Spirochaetaceae bacterium]